MRLRTKYAIALLVLTLVLSGAVVAGLEFYKQQAVGEVRSSVNETVDLVADQIDASIRERRDRIGLIASQDEAAQFNRSDAFLDSFLASSRFYAAQIIAANGTIVSFRGDISQEVRERIEGTTTNATYFTAIVRENEGAYVGDAERIPDTDTYILTFSAPIFEGTGENASVVGVLAASIKLDQTIFGAVDPLETSSQTVTIAAGNRTLEGSNQSFEISTSGSATVESTGWTVTVTRDRSQLSARLRQLGIFQGVGLAIVLFAMIGYGYWQYAISLRQTERLLVGFEEIEQGNYAYDLSLSGGTEWDQIEDGFTDLADGLRQREAALRERQQRLEVMYRALRHNVRNEMSVVLNYAEVIADVAEDNMIVEGAETILSAGRDLTQLSQKARQIENAIEEDAEPTAIEITDAIDDIAGDLREDYPDVDVRLSMPDALSVSALPSIRMAIENLLENACKHNDADDPRVEVTVGRADEGSSVHIAIADNGPGIPEQDRNVIQSGQETSLEHGSGLGLWLVYWIVDKSGGELRFADNEPRGSIVTVELNPASDEPEGPAGEPAEPSASGAVSPSG